MASTTWRFTLPNEKFRLEEINMPEELTASLAGRTVAIQVLPEVPPMTRRIDLSVRRIRVGPRIARFENTLKMKLVGKASENVVEGTVFKHENHDMLDRVVRLLPERVFCHRPPPYLMVPPSYLPFIVAQFRQSCRVD